MHPSENISLFIFLAIALLFVVFALLPVEIIVDEEVVDEELSEVN